jgi:Tol biopolymer transport system component
VAQNRERGDQAFQRLDRNSDGRITPKELPIPQVFKALDSNGDNAITAAEARAAVTEMTPENRRKLAAAIEGVLKRANNQPNSAPVATDHRASYSKNLRIHVGVLGVSDGQPLTEGDDFKPVWSKTGDKIVFFRRVVNAPSTSNWKTAIHIINVDGTGLHKLSDGTYTDFNQTWTRDGTNTPIWNRKRPDGGYMVMASKIGGKPGEERVISDPDGHSWAFSCLSDGRILVSAQTPEHPRRGYYLMTPKAEGKPKYERIDCELAKSGILDRISISPDESKVCFEYQKGFQHKMGGRTLFAADFDAEKRAITNAKPFANKEGKPVWFAYPRWTKDETAIVYHAGAKLYLYKPEDGSTIKVSTDDSAKYIYPHGEATPK